MLQAIALDGAPVVARIGTGNDPWTGRIELPVAACMARAIAQRFAVTILIITMIEQAGYGVGALKQLCQRQLAGAYCPSSENLGACTVQASSLLISSASSGGTMRAENSSMLLASGENRVFSSFLCETLTTLPLLLP